MLRHAVGLGLLVLLAASCWAQETLPSHLGNVGPACKPGVKPSILGWGPDDKAYPDRFVVNPPDGAELVWLPAGRFHMGITPEQRDRLWIENGWDDGWKYTLYHSQPVHDVTLTQGRWLYRHEVTNGQYAVFLAQTGHPAQPQWEGIKRYTRLPVNFVSWDDAEAYGRWAGGSLPTEAQREWAASGPEGRLYPWGDKWDPQQCNSGDYWARKPLRDMPTWQAWFDSLAMNVTVYGTPYLGEVGSLPGNTSWCGACDLAGRIWEWCADWATGGSYRQEAMTDPTGPETGTMKARRGAGWVDLSHNCLAAYRSASPPETRGGLIGFRLALPVN